MTEKLPSLDFGRKVGHDGPHLPLRIASGGLAANDCCIHDGLTLDGHSRGGACPDGTDDRRCTFHDLGFE